MSLKKYSKYKSRKYPKIIIKYMWALTLTFYILMSSNIKFLSFVATSDQHFIFERKSLWNDPYFFIVNLTSHLIQDLFEISFTILEISGSRW